MLADVDHAGASFVPAGWTVPCAGRLPAVRRAACRTAGPSAARDQFAGAGAAARTFTGHGRLFFFFFFFFF